MMVRFASTCDHENNDGTTCDGKRGYGVNEPCGKRSDEYSAWPRCRDCGDHCCPEHQKPGSKTDADLDTQETCLCLLCFDE
jgi:hypothetical protein